MRCVVRRRIGVEENGISAGGWWRREITKASPAYVSVAKCPAQHDTGPEEAIRPLARVWPPPASCCLLSAKARRARDRRNFARQISARIRIAAAYISKRRL